MLKETETKEIIIGFFVTVLSLMTFQLGGVGGPPVPPLATRMFADSTKNALKPKTSSVEIT